MGVSDIASGGARARTRFAKDVEPALQTTGYRGFATDEVSNASLIGVRLYYERLDLFEQVFQRYGGDLKAATHAMMKAAKASPADPFKAIETLVQAPPPK